MIFHTENEKNSHDHPEEKNIIDRKIEILIGRKKHETLTKAIRNAGFRDKLKNKCK